MRGRRFSFIFGAPLICILILLSALCADVFAAERVADRRTATEILEAIVIEAVNWEEVPLSRVISTLEEFSRELDPVENGGANILLLDPDEIDPDVTLRLRDTTLKRVLEIVALYTDFHLEVEEDIAILRAEVEPRERLETEIFPISRHTLRRIIGPIEQPE